MPKNKLPILKKPDEKAIIPFLMGGLPNEELSLAIVNSVIKGGADLIEIGVPYTDPIADGPVIEKYHHQGVAKGLNLPSTLRLIAKIRELSDIPIALFSYYNPIYKLGINKLANECQRLAIDSVIIPDLPFEELILLQKSPLDLIPLVAPSSTPNRLKMLADIEASFVYTASVSGITGVRSLSIEDIKSYLTTVRKYTPLPLALGFGISKPEQIRELKDYADAFVIGSHLVNIIEASLDKPEQMLSKIENSLRAFKRAAK